MRTSPFGAYWPLSCLSPLCERNQTTRWCRPLTTALYGHAAEEGGFFDPEATLTWGAASGTVLLGRTEYTVRVADLQTDTERWNVSYSEARGASRSRFAHPVSQNDRACSIRPHNGLAAKADAAIGGWGRCVRVEA